MFSLCGSQGVKSFALQLRPSQFNYAEITSEYRQEVLSSAPSLGITNQRPKPAQQQMTGDLWFRR